MLLSTVIKLILTACCARQIADNSTRRFDGEQPAINHIVKLCPSGQLLTLEHKNNKIDCKDIESAVKINGDTEVEDKAVAETGGESDVPELNKCGPNQEFSTCGSACQPTCESREPRFCRRRRCVVGCFCKDNFVLNKDGLCVKPYECDEGFCGATATYTTCKMPECRFCDSDGNLLIRSECPSQCQGPGCECKPMFIRDMKTGGCIPEELCN